MINDREKSLRTAIIVIGFAILLIAIAIGCRFYIGADDVSVNREINLSAEEAALQISLEIKQGQPRVEESFDISSKEIEEKQEAVDGENLQKIFYLRVNNTQDVLLFMRLSVLSVTAENHGYLPETFTDAVNVRIYNSTDDIELYKGSLRNLQETTIEIPMEVTAAKKNDTRFRFYFTLDENDAKRYEGCTAQLSASWSVEGEAVEGLKDSQLPSLKIIVYAFIFASIITLLLFFIVHKHRKAEFFGEISTESDNEELSAADKENPDNEELI